MPVEESSYYCPGFRTIELATPVAGIRDHVQLDRNAPLAKQPVEVPALLHRHHRIRLAVQNKKRAVVGGNARDRAGLLGTVSQVRPRTAQQGHGGVFAGAVWPSALTSNHPGQVSRTVVIADCLYAAGILLGIDSSRSLEFLDVACGTQQGGQVPPGRTAAGSDTPRIQPVLLGARTQPPHCGFTVVDLCRKGRLVAEAVIDAHDGEPDDPPLAVGARGLYYNRNRWYSPDLGRFIQRDVNESALPIITALAFNGETLDALLGTFDGQGLHGDGMNLYLYLGGNPVNFSDALGLVYDPFEDLDDFMADYHGERAAAAAAAAGKIGFALEVGKLLAQMSLSFVPGGMFAMAAVDLASGNWESALMYGGFGSMRMLSRFKTLKSFYKTGKLARRGLMLRRLAFRVTTSKGPVEVTA